MADMHTPLNSVEFGWGARPMREQHPVLPEFEADQFDKDNAALTRLSVRGYLTDSQKHSAVAKITKAIGKEIRAALAGSAS
jgi:hypothetical protein